MSDKTITVVMPLNTLANRCGYFFNCNLTKGFEDKPNINNGYNCSHPECEEVHDGVGCCYSFSCPVAYAADGLICQRCGIECDQCGDEECCCDDDLMVCEIPKLEFNDRKMWMLKDAPTIIPAEEV